MNEVPGQIRVHTPAYRVLTGAQLKNADCYGRLVIFGHQNWFRDMDHVFTAPRAREIYLVGHSWMRAAMGLGSGFVASQVPGKPSANPIASGLGVPVEAEAFDPEEILPAIDLQSIIERMNLRVERRTNEGELDYLVESQIIELEEGQLVFLESGDRRYHVIEFDGAHRPTVVTLTVEDLEPGMFLVLRISGGGGDYIEFAADRLLGNDAQWCRDAQNSWKTRLRQIVSAQGMDGVVSEPAGESRGEQRRRKARNLIRILVIHIV